jgi:hypothetical protein
MDPQSQVSGLHALKNLQEPDKAKDILMALRDGLRNKTGVVRLLHTGSADKEMKFKNAGAFKRAFLSGDKLQRSGQVIHDLLKVAGLSSPKADQFLAYVRAQGGRGVNAQMVLQFIDTLRAERGDSAQEALYKFGADLRESGRTLGKGSALAQGPVDASTQVRQRLGELGLRSLEEALQRADQKIKFAAKVTEQDLDIMNNSVASALEQAIFHDLSVLDLSRPAKEREAIYRQIEETFYRSKILAIQARPRDPVDTAQEHQQGIEEFIRNEVMFRDPLIDTDLAYLSDPIRNPVLDRTLGEGKRMGLTLDDVQVMGRNRKRAEISGLQLSEIETALTQVLAGQPISEAQKSMLKLIYLGMG